MQNAPWYSLRQHSPLPQTLLAQFVVGVVIVGAFYSGSGTGSQQSRLVASDDPGAFPYNP